MNLDNKKVLIAYFSRRGANYSNGRIVNLVVGNTEVAAKMIEEETNGDLFEIEADYDYPADYKECTEVAKHELSGNVRPNLTDHLKNIEDYDVIFLGYPNWWGTMPMPVFSFLEEYYFDEKIIMPFCTHEGSGMGHSEKDIKKLCHNAEVKNGLSIHGSSVKNAKNSIVNWIK
ncbi:flavodoxin [Clostridium sp. 19966]|uniref:flavodoxin n=1 Tax=Clostridium sp. 19966 TaxID=2768166 RepID=UPI0028DE74E9|nr:flavodoxin [Clostridium sp. 19966]MDT8719016.1 flavodoxin [Clostridium sp. 19966]